MMNEEREARAKKARALMWKKPMMQDLNWRTITETVNEIAEAAADIRWMDEDDIAEALGDEEEAYSFRIAFSDLAADCERFAEALEEVRRYDFLSVVSDDDDEAALFDAFFPAVNSGGIMLGYDSEEGDYFPLETFVMEYAEREAAKRLMRLTKEQLLDAAGACLRIALQYTAIRYRYDSLESALSILRGAQAGMIRIAKGIEAAYDAAESASDGFRFVYVPAVDAFDRMLTELPDRVWLE